MSHRDYINVLHGHMAQLVARFPCKEEVIGSTPVASTFFGLKYLPWRLNEKEKCLYRRVTTVKVSELFNVPFFSFYTTGLAIHLSLIHI